jgi:hypothetical protein
MIPGDLTTLRFSLAENRVNKRYRDFATIEGKVCSVLLSYGVCLFVMQIGFRRLLPVLFTVMHVTMLFYAAQWQHQSSAFGTSREMYHPAALQRTDQNGNPSNQNRSRQRGKLRFCLVCHHCS